MARLPDPQNGDSQAQETSKRSKQPLLTRKPATITQSDLYRYIYIFRAYDVRITSELQHRVARL